MIQLKKINGDHYFVAALDDTEARVVARAISRGDDKHNAQLVMAENAEGKIAFMAFSGLIYKPE